MSTFYLFLQHFFLVAVGFFFVLWFLELSVPSVLVPSFGKGGGCCCYNLLPSVLVPSVLVSVVVVAVLWQLGTYKIERHSVRVLWKD